MDGRIDGWTVYSMTNAMMFIMLPIILMMIIILFFRFFGLYQGSRQVLEFTWDQPWEYHVLLSGTLCLTPMVAVSQFRPLFPYCAILVAIDAFNEYQEGSKS